MNSDEDGWFRGSLAATYTGIIWDVDPGNCHLLICPGAAVRLPASTWNRVKFAASYVRTSAPSRIDEGSLDLATAEERRVWEMLRSSSTAGELAAGVDDASIIVDSDIVRIELRWRLIYSAISFRLADGETLTYRWTPSLNNSRRVREVIGQAFGAKLV